MSNVKNCQSCKFHTEHICVNDKNIPVQKVNGDNWTWEECKKGWSLCVGVVKNMCGSYQPK